MKLMPSPMPDHAGVYAIIHQPTMTYLIGSTRNLASRAGGWRFTLKSGDRKGPGLLQGLPFDELEFRFVKPLLDETPAQIEAIEQALVDKVTKKGGRAMRVGKGPSNPVHAFGRLDTLHGHALHVGVSPVIVLRRMRRGMTLEEALTHKPLTGRDQAIAAMAVKIMHNGEALTYGEAAHILGRPVDGVKMSLKTMRQINHDIKAVALEDLGRRRSAR